MKGISIIVCCYNSQDRLPKTIEHLARQTFKMPWEIIIVDNLSTDSTSTVAKQEWAKYKLTDVQLRVVQENKAGLSHARQKGVKEAKFDFIIFCDDDNWLYPDYLQTGFELLSNDKSFGAVGGQSSAISDVMLPSWFDSYSQGYAVGKQAFASGDITERGYVWGAGLITRRKLFLETINDKYPSLLTDRKGNSITSGGDYEYCQRLILKGYRLFYHESLTFKHFIPSNRLTESYRHRLFKSFEDSEKCINKYQEAIKIKKLSKNEKLERVKFALKDCVRSIFKRQKLRVSSQEILFYLFNIGFRSNNDYQVIRHFYKY